LQVHFPLGTAGGPAYSGGVENAPKKKIKAALMLGIGVDSDGHKRLTTGSNFALIGGTEETHQAMTEKAVKINEKLAAKGKRLEDVSREEFEDIAQSVGLRRQDRAGEN
jgi:hypothetical protein